MTLRPFVLPLFATFSLLVASAPAGATADAHPKTATLRSIKAGQRAQPAAPDADRTDATLAHATFALGCFWCGETTFEQRPGVKSVTSGYTGGHVDHPTYEQVGTGMTGHFESIDIVYDPKQTTYAKLLDIFWHNVDPTQADGQFCDRGSEYRSVIFYHGEEQHRLALETEKKIAASGRLKKPIVTLIVPASTFYPAEEYHQDFYRKDPQRYHSYREGCGRDARLKEIWGSLDTHAPGLY
ncbi:MAG TPA: peptide-methionine (S)-S-oxide reductase MsrA [Candidatus Saccharimonadaceae bacterium]|jgi:peptide-methionine (S)-S-oxide reductase|nr:peptide-methionine (S)-S-oxide reductase MsrA [Candidatus Saccharimonadaceae bacterium]